MDTGHQQDVQIVAKARVEIPTSVLVQDDVDFFIKFGFRLVNIFPSDDPEQANMEGHGMQLALVRGSDAPAPRIVITQDNPESRYLDGKPQSVSPGGCTLRIEGLDRYAVKPVKPEHRFEVRQLDEEGQSPWTIGRAGMLYRDLIPDRLGGSIIASHIRIEKGGPVPDFVHFHDIGFQLIFCYRGWVELVYEDQGEPFILAAGDCVTQPPQIRHRVLQSSDMLEVVEIGVPSTHMTTLDWDMELPNKRYKPDREWQGQKFCHHKKASATWTPWHVVGFENCNTGVDQCTKNVASVKVIRPLAGVTDSAKRSHTADIHFSFCLSGSADAHVEGKGRHTMHQGTAMTIPPGVIHCWKAVSADFELLEVALPGNFETTLH